MLVKTFSSSWSWYCFSWSFTCCGVAAIFALPLASTTSARCLSSQSFDAMCSFIATRASLARFFVSSSAMSATSAHAVDLRRCLGDRVRQRLDAGRADEAHDLLDAELLVAVVDAVFEVGLHPLRQRAHEARLRGLVAREGRLVREERERRVLEGDARIRCDHLALDRLRRGRPLHLLDELRSDAVDDATARVFGLHREDARNAAGGRVIAHDEVLEADAFAVALPHADQRKRRLFAER